MLRNRPIPVVIAERDLATGNWKDALAAIQQLQDPPLLVVTSRLADEYLWAEALNFGAHDVLAKPFRASELKWVLESAWRIPVQKKQQTLDSTSRRGMSGHREVRF
jgi:DNA-binding response OmpR family regulator